LLIDDSYNANPASMRAALGVLGLTPTGAGGRRIAVIGDMLELGSDAPAFHAGLRDAVESAAVDLVFTAGPLSENLFDVLGEKRRGAHAQSAQELCAIVKDAVHPGDVVMIKGSFGSRMGLIVEALRAHSAAHGGY